MFWKDLYLRFMWHWRRCKWITRTTFASWMVINQTRWQILSRAGECVCVCVCVRVNEMYCEQISIFLIEINEDIPCDVDAHMFNCVIVGVCVCLCCLKHDYDRHLHLTSTKTKLCLRWFERGYKTECNKLNTKPKHIHKTKQAKKQENWFVYTFRFLRVCIGDP